MRFPAAPNLILAVITGAALATVCGCQNNPAIKTSGDVASGDVARNQQLAREQTDQAYELIGRSQFDQAEDLLKKAVVNDPLYGPAQNDMGLIFFHRRDLYDAAWEFENAERLMPRQAAPANNLGLVLEESNKLSDAEKSYANAVSLEPDNPEYAGNYARARIRLGERDETTRKLLQQIILRDRRPDWVAWAREQASRLAKAEPTSEQSP